MEIRKFCQRDEQKGEKQELMSRNCEKEGRRELNRDCQQSEFVQNVRSMQLLSKVQINREIVCRGRDQGLLRYLQLGDGILAKVEKEEEWKAAEKE
jgi:hypothetical protein